ncbi:MAG: hypothetical protein LBM95_08410 [Lactobacillales bacterium]|jgi:type IV pilus assembly protein PilM|nr:hypothetical protein [Lactobacillales bacterium]
MFKKEIDEVVGLEIAENVLRFCLVQKRGLTFGECISNGSFVKNERLRNEDEFSDLLHKLLKSHKLSHKNIVYSALNSKLLIRTILNENFGSEKEIYEYIFLELGNSIVLPFDNPVFDLLVLDNKSGKNKKIPGKRNKEKDVKKKTIKRNRFSVKGSIPFIATSQTVLESIGDGITKSGNQPVAVDCNSLAYVRVFRREIKVSENFLLVEFDSGTATITIFEEFSPVFVQHEEYNKVNWRYIEKNGTILPSFDEIKEQEQLVNLSHIISDVCTYFENALSMGNHISHIYLVGNHPLLRTEVTTIIQSVNSVEVTPLISTITNSDGKLVPNRFMLSLGLALKEL